MAETTAAVTPLRIAIVGAGQMARHHAGAILRIGHLAELSAVCDPSETARHAFRNVAPKAMGYGSLADALRSARFDVVHVVTPPETHEALAEQALEAGCHIYVEKPFVETEAAAERLLALAARHGLKICAGHQLLFEAPSLGVRRYLSALGDLKHVESYFSFHPVHRSADGRAAPPDDLQLVDILPHPVYLLVELLERMGGSRIELTGLDLGPSGTIHALLRRGAVTGSLVVTIEARPVDSYLRIVGTNGSVHADFVRGTLQRNLGPGISGIDKLLAPYRQASQLLTGTTASMARRLLTRQRSYPGLVEIFSAFYTSVREGTPSPVSPEQLRETVRICAHITRELESLTRGSAMRPAAHSSGPSVIVTGGTGFLGTEVARLLAARHRRVRVLVRREPPGWKRVPGVEYTLADLARPLPAEVFAGTQAVVHCAAETAGGYEQHQQNSIDATEHLIRAAAAAKVTQFLHISSISVMAHPQRGKLVDESSPLEPNSREVGPYAWGKTVSEELATRLSRELGMQLRIVRPGAFVDYHRFEPPGLLGKRLGNLFIAVGSPKDPLAVVDIGFAARTLVWILDHFEEAPVIIHVFDPAAPTKADLLARLRLTNPDLTVVWLPRGLLVPLSWAAILLQRVLRPKNPPLNVARIFARQRYDYSLIARLTPGIGSQGGASSAAPADTVEEPGLVAGSR